MSCTSLFGKSDCRGSINSDSQRFVPPTKLNDRSCSKKSFTEYFKISCMHLFIEVLVSAVSFLFSVLLVAVIIGFGVNIVK